MDQAVKGRHDETANTANPTSSDGARLGSQWEVGAVICIHNNLQRKTL